MKAITLFSGGGLADVGYEAAGYEVVGACEMDPAIAAIHQLNFPLSRLHIGEVATFPMEGWGDIDLIHLSPPCQQYSAALSYKYRLSDYQDPIVDVLPIVQTIRPRAVVLENVKDYLRAPCFAAFNEGLTAAGYTHLFCEVLDMRKYQVPQTRRRLISIWSLSPEIVISFCNGSVGWYEAISDLVMETTSFTGWLYKYSSSDLKHAVEVRAPGKFLLSPCGFRRNKKKMTAIPETGQSFTVIARHNKQLVAYIDGDFYQLRSRQYARLQTVPDYYQLPEAFGLAKKVIGNGVPPAITYQIGLSLSGSGFLNDGAKIFQILQESARLY